MARFSAAVAIQDVAPVGSAPKPAWASASTAAVVPSPGLAGATAPPRSTWVPSNALLPVAAAGVHPSWLPEMGVDGVADEVNVDSCPETDQPGKVFRVSEMVTFGSAPEALEPLTVSDAVAGVATVTVSAPVAATVTLIVTGLLTAVRTLEEFRVVVPDELRNDVLVGLKLAVSVTAEVNGDGAVKVVVATPLAFTGTVAMVVAPFMNATLPAVAGVSVAVSVTVAPAAAGFGDALSVVAVGVATGPAELVVYVVAPAAIDTKVDWTYWTLPVAPAPEKQPTAHSTVPGAVGLTPAKFSSAPTLPCRVPLNPVVRPALTFGEMMVDSTPPGAVNSVTWAAAWKPVGHPVVVCHVGVSLRLPPVTTAGGVPDSSCSWPGPEPTAASAEPEAASPAPAVRPTAARITAPRRSRPAVIHFRFSFIAGVFSLSVGGRAECAPAGVRPGYGTMTRCLPGHSGSGQAPGRLSFTAASSAIPVQWCCSSAPAAWTQLSRTGRRTCCPWWAWVRSRAGRS